MSVSNESLIGDWIYVIEGFIAQTVVNSEGSLDLENSIELKVGDAVIYQDWYYEKRDDNISIMIKYKQSDSEEYWNALETYFVTEEVWVGLREYFTK